MNRPRPKATDAFRIPLDGLLSSLQTDAPVRDRLLYLGVASSVLWLRELSSVLARRRLNS